MKSKTKPIKNELKITKDMTFEQVLSKHPELAQEMFALGMHCVGCSAAAFETLEMGALSHGINPNKLVKCLNDKLEKRSKSK
jgi:hybrid cluster-associated redox disulfide protein